MSFRPSSKLVEPTSWGQVDVTPEGAGGYSSSTPKCANLRQSIGVLGALQSFDFVVVGQAVKLAGFWLCELEYVGQYFGRKSVDWSDTYGVVSGGTGSGFGLLYLLSV